jgi:hypothetical protein
MKTCPYCLKKVPDGARKCGACGEWVEPEIVHKYENLKELGKAVGGDVKRAVEAAKPTAAKVGAGAGAVGLIILLLCLSPVVLGFGIAFVYACLHWSEDSPTQAYHTMAIVTGLPFAVMLLMAMLMTVSRLRSKR